MPDTSFREVLMSCKSIESQAAKIYQAISEETEDDEQREFWQDISEDEKRHVSYWEKLLELSDKGVIHNVFDRPGKTMDEINAMTRRISAMLNETHKLSDVSSAVLLAFRLESLMVNPSFAILFHLMKEQPGNGSPEDDYQEHLDKFVRFVKKISLGKPELELIGDILSRMWTHNKELANQFVQKRTLQGLIPICAACKKVRDDQGYWNQIESYLRDHSDAEFSHGMCPECVKKLYPLLDKQDK